MWPSRLAVVLQRKRKICRPSGACEKIAGKATSPRLDKMEKSKEGARRASAGVLRPLRIEMSAVLQPGAASGHPWLIFCSAGLTIGAGVRAAYDRSLACVGGGH